MIHVKPQSPCPVQLSIFAPEPFKSSRQAQRFLLIHDQIANLFHIPIRTPLLLIIGAHLASEPLLCGERSQNRRCRLISAPNQIVLLFAEIA